MPYARFDDRYDDHKKIKRAWRREPAAVALHAMAITYCNRHVSDGEVDIDWIEERLAALPYTAKQRERVIDVLLELNLFERKDAETFLVHDFLHWNLSSIQRRARHRHVAARLRRAVLRRDGFVCRLCGGAVAANDVHLDHIIPVIHGGEDSLENLQVAHSQYNLRKGAR